MFKKIFSLLCTLMCAGNLFAYDFYVNRFYYNKLGGDSVKVTYKTYRDGGYSGFVSIPETVTYSNTTYRVTTIGTSAFQGCSGLTYVIIPNSVTTIEYDAFWDCSGLTSVTIPNSVTTIGNYAFRSCTGLTSVAIPNSITTIGKYAFEGCSSLKSINVDAANTHYASIDGVLFNYAKDTLIQYPIGNSRKEYTIPNSVTTIGDYAFYDCDGLTSVTIPNSVTSIGWYAFHECTRLTSVTIGNSVTTIGWRAFYGCSGLKSINVDAANTHYASIDGVLFNYAKDTLIQYPASNSRTEYIIPNSVTTIGDYAFKGCSGLTSVTIPNSVTTIGEYAFKECTRLTSVTIGNSVTTIGSSVFSGCSGLTSVTIGNSVTMVGDYAFEGCKYLVDIYCYAPMPPAAQSSSFANYNVFLHVPCDNLRVYQTDIVFGSFKYIECISAEEKPITGDEVTVNPSADNVTITWPANDNASEYKLVITKDGIVFCTLTFNAQGQLTGIAFAPNRNGSRMLDAAVMTANGWQFTVTGLDQASKYGYTIDALNASKQSIKHYEGEFATDGYTSLEWVTSDKIQGINKMLLDGNLYLLRDGNLFTATGARVK